MDPNLLLILIFAFATVVLFVTAVYLAWGDILGMQRDWFIRRMGDETPAEKRKRLGVATPVFTNLKRIASDPFGEETDPGGWREKFQILISQANLPLTSEAVMVRSGLLGISLAGLVLVGTGNVSASILVGLVAGSFPLVHVLSKRHKRLEHMRSQLPDAFSLMARVMRSGQTTSQAVLSVTEEFSEPLKGEFMTCYQQQNLGLPAEAALRDLARRTGLLEIRMFVVATIVQSQTGGNLAEALEDLAQVIRDRFRVRSMIRTITAEGRFQAAILLALPAFMFLVMSVVNWEYASILLNYPHVLLAGLVSECLGAIWIWRIVNFDF